MPLLFFTCIVIRGNATHPLPAVAEDESVAAPQPIRRPCHESCVQKKLESEGFFVGPILRFLNPHTCQRPRANRLLGATLLLHCWRRRPSY